MAVTLVLSAMAMTMMVVSAKADVANQQTAQHQQAYRLPEGERREAEERWHEPVPQPHDEGADQGHHHHEKEGDEYEMLLKYCHCQWFFVIQLLSFDFLGKAFANLLAR